MMRVSSAGVGRDSLSQKGTREPRTDVGSSQPWKQRPGVGSRCVCRGCGRVGEGWGCRLGVCRRTECRAPTWERFKPQWEALLGL